MRGPLDIRAHDRHVSRMIFTKAGDSLVSAGVDNLVGVWSASGREWLGMIEEHANNVNCMALSRAEDSPGCSPDGRNLALGAADRRARIWGVWGSRGWGQILLQHCACL